MADYIHELAGACRDYVFDTPYYDAVTGQFIDQSIYGRDHPIGNISTVVGTPTFTTMAGGNHKRGIKLDRSWQGKFPCPIPFEGWMYAEFEFHFAADAYLYPLLFHNLTNEEAGCRMRVLRSSGTRSVAFSNATYGENNFGATFNTDDDPCVFLAGFDQATNNAYRTVDGVTVTDTAGSSVTTSGWPMAPAGSEFVRIGDIDGDGTTTPSSNYVILSRLAFGVNRPTTAAELAKLQGVMTAGIASAG